jgi:hypothetical protein
VALVQKSAFALFGDFARLVKHMRFPAQTRESLHFRAPTRTIVKRFFVHRAAEIGANIIAICPPSRSVMVGYLPL